MIDFSYAGSVSMELGRTAMHPAKFGRLTSFRCMHTRYETYNTASPVKMIRFPLKTMDTQAAECFTICICSCGLRPWFQSFRGRDETFTFTSFILVRIISLTNFKLFFSLCGSGTSARRAECLRVPPLYWVPWWWWHTSYSGSTSWAGPERSWRNPEESWQELVSSLHQVTFQRTK